MEWNACETVALAGLVVVSLQRRFPRERDWLWRPLSFGIYCTIQNKVHNRHCRRAIYNISTVRPESLWFTGLTYVGQIIYISCT